MQTIKEKTFSTYLLNETLSENISYLSTFAPSLISFVHLFDTIKWFNLLNVIS